MPGMRGNLVSDYYATALLAEAFEGELGEGTRSAAWRRFARLWRGVEPPLGPSSGVRTIFDRSAAPIVEMLGFSISDFQAGRSGDTVLATLDGRGVRVGLVVAAFGQALEAVWREATRHGIGIDAAWSLGCNGRQLRLVDACRSYSRSFLEFDLAVAASDERCFAVLWALLRAEAFGAGTAGAALEPARPLLDRVIEASSRHSRGVCRSLRGGVVEALVHLLQGIVSSRVRRGRDPARTDLAGAYGESLTLVYRILFLLFAESRALVPLWHPVYRGSYSIETLREEAESPGSHRGTWEALLAISRLAHAGCKAGTLRVTPFNGRLFAPSRTALAEAAGIDDEAAARALVALSTEPGKNGRGRSRVDYRDLGVEQLGAVYETVLDYDPVIVSPATGTGMPNTAVRRAALRRSQAGREVGTLAARNRLLRRRDAGDEAASSGREGTLLPRVHLESGSGRRKASGTFYTPAPVTDYLVRRTLFPLVANASPDEVLNLRIVDPAMGSGAFLVAACRYLAEAYEAALVAGGSCGASEIDEAERASFRRLVAERCLYGVDVNPMAVELGRLSIWLTTLAADVPLTFLDHHLMSGDSLAGASIADLLRQPPGGGGRRATSTALPLFDPEALENDLKSVVPSRLRLAREPADTLEAVREKERLLSALHVPGAAHARWKRALDLWCAGWFWPPETVRPEPRTFAALVDRLLGRHSSLPARVAQSLLQQAEAVAKNRHFFHWELEFPEVFYEENGSRASRAGFDAVLTNPPWDMLRADSAGGARREEAGADPSFVRFARSSGVYRAQSSGHLNRFQLFVERSCRLAPFGGRVGIVAPWGLVTDHGSAALRRMLFDRCSVDALVGLDNAKAIFPIHRSVRFVLLTATTGATTDRILCRFGEQLPERLDSIPGDGRSPVQFPVVLSRSVIDRFSGEDAAVPDVRSAADLALLEKVLATCPPLASAEGWNARFGRELNATDDCCHFVESGTGIPILEGKQIGPFVVDTGASRYFIAPSKARALLGPQASYRSPRLGYRDVASATNRLTLIAAIVPAGCLTTHTIFCLKTPLAPAEQGLLCGVFNSFVANYLVRLRVVTHVTVNATANLPVPLVPLSDPVAREVSALAVRLGKGRGGSGWGACYARLQALVAQMYSLSLEELEIVLSALPLVEQRMKRAVLDRFLKLESRREA